MKVEIRHVRSGLGVLAGGGIGLLVCWYLPLWLALIVIAFSTGYAVGVLVESTWQSRSLSSSQP